MKLALIGFGTVGQGLATILRDRGETLRGDYGFDGQIVAVSTARRGSLYDPNGLDIVALLENAQDFSGYPESEGLQRGWSTEQIIREGNADAVVEVTPTDITSGQPAIWHIQTALESGKHAISANKGPAALAFRDLNTLAKANGVEFYNEATVIGGTPAIRLGEELLAGSGITEMRGILNGTTNYMLTRMEGGATYMEALTEAQRLGYAETDPTADVEGHDAAAKVMILANVLMGGDLKNADVPRQGISALSLEEVQDALKNGEHYKLIGKVWREGGQTKASVELMRLPGSDPLAGVAGADMAITYSTDLMRHATISGAGAGAIPTGFALLSDLLAIHRKSHHA
jgi:homoserine dehydrogenase